MPRIGVTAASVELSGSVKRTIPRHTEKVKGKLSAHVSFYRSLKLVGKGIDVIERSYLVLDFPSFLIIRAGNSNRFAFGI